jgi:hypothetical protein
MGSARDVVDYTLQRRALLADVAAGRRARAEVCDAHPYLLMAARHYGEPLASACPVCASAEHRLVHYVYGEALGHSTGQAKSVRELTAMASRHTQFSTYAVEVCSTCGWNHLVRSFSLGASESVPDVAAGR